MIFIFIFAINFLILLILLILFFGTILGLLALKAYSQDTTISYKGQPPAAAMAPSISAFGNDVCTVPVVGAVSSTVIGFSGGTMYTDSNCERIKLAKTLNDLGLKVAAVSILCQDDRVFEAMMQSGSPCPINGSIGDAAKRGWYERNPSIFKKLYGDTYTIPLVPDEPITITNPKGK